MIGSGIFVLPGLAFKIAGPSVVLRSSLPASSCFRPPSPRLRWRPPCRRRAAPTSTSTEQWVRSWEPLPDLVCGSPSSSRRRSPSSDCPHISSTSFPIPSARRGTARHRAHRGEPPRCQADGEVPDAARIGRDPRPSGVRRNRHATHPILLVRSVHAHGIKGLLSATAVVFVSYAGVTKVASIAEEVRRPGRNIPMGMLVSIGFMMLLYPAIVAVIVGVSPAAELTKTETPMTLAAEQFVGSFGVAIIAGVAVIALLSMTNAGIIASARYPFAMARNSLAPRQLAAIGRTIRGPDRRDCGHRRHAPGPRDVRPASRTRQTRVGLPAPRICVDQPRPDRLPRSSPRLVRAGVQIAVVPGDADLRNSRGIAAPDADGNRSADRSGPLRRRRRDLVPDVRPVTGGEGVCGARRLPSPRGPAPGANDRRGSRDRRDENTSSCSSEGRRGRVVSTRCSDSRCASRWPPAGASTSSTSMPGRGA